MANPQQGLDSQKLKTSSLSKLGSTTNSLSISMKHVAEDWGCESCDVSVVLLLLWISIQNKKIDIVADFVEGCGKWVRQENTGDTRQVGQQGCKAWWWSGTYADSVSGWSQWHSTVEQPLYFKWFRPWTFHKNVGAWSTKIKMEEDCASSSNIHIQPDRQVFTHWHPTAPLMTSGNGVWLGFCGGVRASLGMWGHLGQELLHQLLVNTDIPKKLPKELFCMMRLIQGMLLIMDSAKQSVSIFWRHEKSDPLQLMMREPWFCRIDGWDSDIITASISGKLSINDKQSCLPLRGCKLCFWKKRRQQLGAYIGQQKLSTSKAVAEAMRLEFWLQGKDWSRIRAGRNSGDYEVGPCSPLCLAFVLCFSPFDRES